MSDPADHGWLRARLEQLLDGGALEESDAEQLLVALTDASVPPVLAGALLAALRAKGETAAEIRGLARGMRSLARTPALPAEGDTIDVVGTGGDHSHSLNLSTGAGLLAAAAGLAVVKHGNRSVSSKCGSADVLETLGLPLPLDETGAAACLSRTGFTFLFAPHYHPAMKTLAPIRRTLGIRTAFNLLGPLTNPATPPYGLIGAYSPAATALMADTLAGLEVEHYFVVHGTPGWDEATPVGPFELYDVRPGSVQRWERDPAEAGIARCPAAALAGGDAAYNAAAIRDVLCGDERGAHRDALALGAGLMLEVAGRAASMADGVAMAQAAIDDGRARTLLEELAAFGAGR